MRTHMQLAPAELERLLACYAAKRDAHCRDRIIEAHLYIAEIVARKFSGKGVDYDDLYQVAAMALLKALDRFEQNRGVKFASFVTPAMVGEVKNYFRDRSRMVRLPRRSAELMRRVNQEKEALYQELGRYPRVDELSERLNMPEDDVIEALEAAASQPVSLDMQTTDDDEDFTLSSVLGVQEGGFADFEQTDMLRRGLAALGEDLKEIVRMRYFENLSQREVAAKIGVSQMWVSRAEKRALEQLRKAMKIGEDG